MNPASALGRLLQQWKGSGAANAAGGEPMPARILLTGAAGQVATLIRPLLREVVRDIRLTDIRPVTPEGPGEEFVLADLSDAVAVSDTVRGVEGIVHLGAIAKEAPYDELIPANVHGMIHLLEAAREHGVRRVVLASSMHVLGFYDRDEAVTPASVPRPDSRYAVTKLFAENLASYYADKFGLRIACLRIGHVTARREDAEPASWTAPSDLVALIRLGLTHPDVRFEVLHALACYRGDDVGQHELRKRFGFVGESRGGSYTAALRYAGRRFAKDPIARRLRGGVFASTKASRLR